MTAEPSVHVIDDDEAMRDSLSFLLASAGCKVRAYASAAEFLAGIETLGAGCVVTDMRMPEITGLDVLKAVRARAPHLAVIMITGHGDVALAVSALKQGAADFIEKPFDDEVILAAVRAALDRQEEDGRQDAERAVIAARIGLLSTRERQVLGGLVAGKANKVIAQDLDISPRTVEVYRANVMTKMQAGSLSELVRMAIAAGETPA